VTVRCAFCDTWNRIDIARAHDRPKCGKCTRPLLLDRPIPLNDETFERTIQGSEVPVLVDFYADWCGPCKMMAPEVDAVAGRLGIEIPVSIDQRIRGAARVGDHKTSMLQDLESGRPLEIDAITGSVVELAGRLGVPVPHLETIYASVKVLSAVQP